MRFPLAVVLTAVSLTAPPVLRARDVEGGRYLDLLLARYDVQPNGPARDALANQIDALAHQRYATVSRLYWHTDADAARRAARASGRPILHLRMLGRLDEDLSCANSRLFRVVLYANQDISQFLSDHFVLLWSSERPVPQVTIDFGDGRKIVRTSTGNSAHYVLDEDGNVLDVLPGLYAPVAFRRELEASLVLASRVRGKTSAERSRLVRAYHEQLVGRSENDWRRLAGTSWALDGRQSLTNARVERDLAAAQAATVSKARMELPDLRAFAPGLAPGSVSDGQVDTWSALGQALYNIVPSSVLDEASRSLITRVHNDVTTDLRTVGPLLDVMTARLEQTIVADTALNELRLRPQMSREIVRRAGRADFNTLNAWIYADVFHTPQNDPWLGLLPRDVFTGVPGDGVVRERR